MGGLIHFDLKLRNILVLRSIDPKERNVILCDLDAASPIGATRGTDEKRGSSAYFAPEVARWVTTLQNYEAINASASSNSSKIKENVLKSDPSIDVWSFGVILFELCSGVTLFPQDLNSDCLKDPQDMTRLCLWSCIEDVYLDNLFADSETCTDLQKRECAHLIRWCLQGDPKDRPSFEQILSHPFLIQNSSAFSLSLFFSSFLIFTYNTTTESIVMSQPMPMRNHFFVSHMQAEAAGDVGTLCLFLKRIGVNCWRDMDASDLTEKGMRRGVETSDAFIIFLTNSYLSRPFCQKEIMWALEFKKPILIVVEEEERFFAWDIERWKTNRCSRAHDGTWTTGWLSKTYEECPKQVKDLIESNITQMIPFRRRLFESRALVREIVARTYKSGAVSWGNVMPVQSSRAHALTSLWPSLRVVVIHDTSSQTAKDMVRMIHDTMKDLWSNVVIVNTVKEADKSICLLTKNILSGESLKMLSEDVQFRDAKSREYVYVLEEHSKDEAWDWSLPGKLNLPDEPEVEQAIRSCIYSHEAYKWRDGDLEYEHHAMVHDMTKKLVGDVGRSVARRISVMAKRKRRETERKKKNMEMKEEDLDSSGDVMIVNDVKIAEEEEEKEISKKKKNVKGNKVVPI